MIQVKPQYSTKGIILGKPDFLAMDPTAKPIKDIIFISHPHSDHHPRSVKRGISLISSQSTFNILRYKLKSYFKHHDSMIIGNWKLSQIPSGHMFGSTALLIENLDTNFKILYTGDVNDRTRFGIKGFKPIKTDVLIIEATYGSPKYVFPEPEIIISEAYDVIEDLSKKGIVFIHAYALGKSQTILSSPIKELITGISPEINTYNKLFSKTDFKNNLDIPVTQNYEKSGVFLVSKKPRTKSPKKYSIFFTGWALSKINARYVFPLSDHADFEGLFKIVKQTRAEKIFTLFGHSEEFAKFLQAQGFEALSLDSLQKRIDEW